ncbi:MAG: PD40 domain-containing protein, partial [Flavobacteriales bacterium]|nr:PD40 domain-containing protein [Flavobacteriales bacterium]
MRTGLTILVFITVSLLASAQFKGDKLPETINSTSDELSPVLSPDGQSMFFVRSLHPDNMGGSTLGQDVWESKIDENGNWSEAENLGAPINNKDYNGISGIGKNGELLLTNFTNSNGAFVPGISIANAENGGYATPQIFYPSSMIGQTGFLNFYASPALDFIILSTMLDTKNQEDLFFSEKVNGSWSALQLLSDSINTTGFETSPYLSKDGKKLFFASNGHGGQGDADIFMSTRLDTIRWDLWSKPVPIKEVNTVGFDGYFVLDSSEEVAYFVSGDNPQAMGDIYSIKTSDIELLTSVQEVILLEKTVHVTGIVINQKTNEPIAAEIVFTDLETNKRIDSTYTKTEGSYEIDLPSGKTYSITAEKEGYFSISETLDLQEIEDDAEMVQHLGIAPVEVGQTIKMNNIFFEL